MFGWKTHFELKKYKVDICDETYAIFDAQRKKEEERRKKKKEDRLT